MSGKSQNVQGMVDYLKQNGKPVKLFSETNSLSMNDIIILETKDLSQFRLKAKDLKTSHLVIGEGFSSDLYPELKAWQNSEVILEDTGRDDAAYKQLKSLAAYCVPFVSFKYHSDAFLA